MSSRRAVRLAAVAVFVTLSTAAAGAQDKDELHKCDKSFGTLAVHEPQQDYMAIFQRFSLVSPTALIRAMAQSSNCFMVVERGAAMQNVQQERTLARAGEMQSGSNMGGGQVAAADFVLTAAIQVVEKDAGGVGGIVGGFLARRSPMLGALGAGVKFKEASTSLLIADARTSVQLASAEGKARESNISLGALGVVASGGAALGAYTNTAEGKVIAASYLDNFNNLIDKMKADPALVARADRFKTTTLAGGEVALGPSFAEGDVLRPKIDNIKLISDAIDGAKEVATLRKTDELVYLGVEKDGYLKVQGSALAGWVRKTLVAK